MGEVTPQFLAAVSEHTGVPASLLSGDTPAAVWDSARAGAAVDWKTAAPPTPPQPPCRRHRSQHESAPNSLCPATTGYKPGVPVGSHPNPNARDYVQPMTSRKARKARPALSIAARSPMYRLGD